MAALKAETGKLGAPKVGVNNLYFGKTKVSNDLIDAVVKAQGGVATLFGKNGKEFVRAATTVKRRTVRARWEPLWVQIAARWEASTVLLVSGRVKVHIAPARCRVLEQCPVPKKLQLGRKIAQLMRLVRAGPKWRPS